MLNDQTLLDEITKWAAKYHFSFQFWGEGDNNVFIRKNGIDLYSTGGCDTPRKAIFKALEYIYRINNTKKDQRFR